ncbi:hypothetical protein V6Z11_A11G331700 [Gossypium hirsutum]
MKLRKLGYPNELRGIIRRGVDIKYACTWLCPPRNRRSMILQRPVKINTINIGFRRNRSIIELRSNRSTRFKNLAGIRWPIGLCRCTTNITNLLAQTLRPNRCTKSIIRWPTSIWHKQSWPKGVMHWT